jgi:cation diffusion facilitator family transporter
LTGPTEPTGSPGEDRGGSPPDPRSGRDGREHGSPWLQDDAGWRLPAESLAFADDQPSSPADSGNSGDSLFTVVLAFVVNAVIAVAKTAAAVITGSASMVAESAHSWADTGNEIFLILAERRGSRPRDDVHPRGYGRDTYIWSMVAAFGLFTAGAVVSIWHGISELTDDRPETDYLINYIVLAIAFVLEGISFRQAFSQSRSKARVYGVDPLEYVSATSNTTLRAVFFEDASALIGLVLAALGVGLHQLTGSAVYDALGSIAVGLLLAFAAIFLINRNRRYLLGESLPPELLAGVLEALLQVPALDRVTYLHLEYVGPARFFVVAAVDLTGDDAEHTVAVRLRRLEAELEKRDIIEDAVLTLSAPDEPSLTPDGLRQAGSVAR